MSHPVWVRGLKHILRVQGRVAIRSHPVWVRGLKQTNCKKWKITRQVAPRVGAWIETPAMGVCTLWPTVAPRVGAWIETKC